MLEMMLLLCWLWILIHFARSLRFFVCLIMVPTKLLFFRDSGLLEYWIRPYVRGRWFGCSLLSPAWDAAKLTLPGSRLHRSFRDHRPYRFMSIDGSCPRTNLPLPFSIKASSMPVWHYSRGQPPRRFTVAEAAEEGSQLRRSHEGCRDSAALQGRARGRILLQKIPGPRTRLMDLPLIENQWCYMASYILWYIAHAIFNAT